MVIRTIDVGRPQPSSSIGPTTYWLDLTGNTVPTVASTVSARATRLRGISTSSVRPSRMSAPSAEVSIARLSPNTPPTALSVKPRKISIGGSNCTDMITMKLRSPLTSWTMPNA